MSMNKFMHPRNIYRQKPDFQALVKQYPEMNQVATVDLNGRIKLDYKDRKALQLLTTCLLRRDFGLELDLPPDKLVPTLPLRLNYILWLEDLEDAFEWRKTRSEVRGLDIGCGASCIYPLLGVAHSERRWKMIGLELLEDSVEFARRNVERNGLADCIEVVQQEKDCEDILTGFMEGRGDLDFCMCNPPFYEDEIVESENRTSRRKEPSNAATGCDKELRIEGGELRFLERIIDESLVLKERISIYTSMVGHKRNFEEILRIMKSRSINNITTTRFCQGNTTRWGIAWSFSSATLLAKVPDRFEQESSKRKSPGKPLDGRILSLDDVPSLDAARSKLLAVLAQLDLELKPLADAGSMWELSAQENTWSHQRRRRRGAQRKPSPGSENRSNEERENGAVPSGGTPSKRLKADNQRTEPVLRSVLALKSREDGYYLALSYLSGIAGRDALNQILQFVKNNIQKAQ